MSRSEEDLRRDERERQRTSDAILDSEAPKKLVVAGPGTGKTHNFRRVLEKAGGGLAITFIRALARDLDRDLGDLAQVNTFHGYCKNLAHTFGGVEGLTANFSYFPSLPKLVLRDLAALGQPGLAEHDLERPIRLMEQDSALVQRVLEIGNYYDTVAHTDVVYRVQRHLEHNPEAVPEHPVVVVDEYQDFNLLETRLIDALAGASPVLIAGDDDQALYGFKDASPAFIRELALRDDVQMFDLPYCSRCTEVVVAAVNQLVDEAQRRGNLAGRVPRQYLCYLPEKGQDSDDHPLLIHAHCSVDNNKSPYMRRYIAEQINEIPAKDIEASHAGPHATALVVGRLHYVSQVYNFLVESGFTSVRLQRSEGVEIHLLDGYRRLARNGASRLGWRILLHLEPCENLDTTLQAIHQDGAELNELLPEDYKQRHLNVAAIVHRLLDGEDLDADQIAELTAALGMDIEAVREELRLEPEEERDQGEPEQDPDAPSIICTSLVGAKGLSAEHVFVVGFVNGDLPKEPSAVTDDEVCELIVALSRTRKACHLVSCGMWSGQWKEESAFLDWLGDIAVERRDINKDYWA